MKLSKIILIDHIHRVRYGLVFVTPSEKGVFVIDYDTEVIFNDDVAADSIITRGY